jgi:hypothetical protein
MSSRIARPIGTAAALLTILGFAAATGCDANRPGAQPLPAWLEARIRSHEGREWPRPPLSGERVERRAWDHYRLAIEALASIHRELDQESLARAYEAMDGLRHPGAPVSPACHRFLEQAAVVLRQVERGACAPVAGSGFDVRGGYYTKDAGSETDRYDSVGWYSTFLGNLFRVRALQLLDSGDAVARSGA